MTDMNSSTDPTNRILSLPGDWICLPAQSSRVALSLRHGAFILGQRPTLQDPDGLLALLPCLDDSPYVIENLEELSRVAWLPKQPGWYSTLKTCLETKQQTPAPVNLLANLRPEQQYRPEPDRKILMARLRHLRRNLARVFAHTWINPGKALKNIQRDLAKTSAASVMDTIRNNPHKYSPPFPAGKRQTRFDEEALGQLELLAETLNQARSTKREQS